MATYTNTDVSNMALSHIGETRIADYTDTSEPNPATVYCRLHLPHVRDALLRNNLFPFSKKRAILGNAGKPAFEWNYSFRLPDDYLKLIGIYDGSDTSTGKTTASYEIEGDNLLWDYSECKIWYIRQVTEPDDWDELFWQVMELSLASRLIIPLGQDLKTKEAIDKELQIWMPRVKAMNRQEQRKIGRDNLKTWNGARRTNIPSYIP